MLAKLDARLCRNQHRILNLALKERYNLDSLVLPPTLALGWGNLSALAGGEKLASVVARQWALHQESIVGSVLAAELA
jgi:hypothetical protein